MGHGKRIDPPTKPNADRFSKSYQDRLLGGPELDIYSAFYENDRQTSTGLDGYLRGRGVDVVAIVGLALDHCVAWSSEDAVRLGYRTRVLLPGCRAINRGGSLERAIASMRQVGVALETSVELG